MRSRGASWPRFPRPPRSPSHRRRLPRCGGYRIRFPRGKNGVAIIPVDREPRQATEAYSDDRVFAFLSLEGDTAIDKSYRVVATSHPAIRVELDGIDNLGQEFFRWEFATAVAGAVMNLNPFDQPAVESAKIEARKITDKYETTGSLPDEVAFFEADGMMLFSSDAYAKTLHGSSTEPKLKDVLDAHISQITADDYFAVLGYVEMNTQTEAILQSIREKVCNEMNRCCDLSRIWS